MIYFFSSEINGLIALEADKTLNDIDINKLNWLLGNARLIADKLLKGPFVGPRKEMITPWSTNAVEITQNMGLTGIKRIERFKASSSNNNQYDKMLEALYTQLDQNIFLIEHIPEPVQYIQDIHSYNQKEGLALSDDEVKYLEEIGKKIGRRLTDSEIFGFSQVNSEHCRHKIFNGTFIIDGQEKKSSLFELIKKTTHIHLNRVISAYKDNCAFLAGPVIDFFAPLHQDKPDFFVTEKAESVISLKAETHNFPTTVEPFNGAATGTGGEIRDRIAGGKAAFPLAGTAVYMTSYPRLGHEERDWEKKIPAREWLYQSPREILIKASNGASDFGNKFGQPLICGSVLTFEHEENGYMYGYDKVIMLAGGIGYGKKQDSLKDKAQKDDIIVLLGGDNYRIGMGGGAVSSVATGEYGNTIELNAVQRSNPEMQKRVYNAIRALAERQRNPIVSIHDHGAGGHLNCLSELVEDTGGTINMDKLPLGDPTLSAKEIVGNESQERMGLLIKKRDVETLDKIARRERAPFYVIGKTTGDQQFTFESKKKEEKPIDLQLSYMFGKPPKTVMIDETKKMNYEAIKISVEETENNIKRVLQIEAVACKDWLTNKVDRSVTGKIARQQTAGELQLPLNNLGIAALDYTSYKGVATSIGHAPVSALIDPEAGSVLSIAEALTNIVWTPLQHGIHGVSLSANWMWPCKNPGEDARLYKAVEAASEFAIALGINIPTGKDSLSMTQKYKNGEKVFAPGTVIISAAGEVSDFRKTVEPVMAPLPGSDLIYLDFSKDELKTGGSSFAQINNAIGNGVPTVKDPAYFIKAFNVIQKLIEEGLIIAGHDISSGGLITSLLEMTFSNSKSGFDADITVIPSINDITTLFSENPGVIIQVVDLQKTEQVLNSHGINFYRIGKCRDDNKLNLKMQTETLSLSKEELRDTWFRTSYLLDCEQTGQKLAFERYQNYKTNILHFEFPAHFNGKLDYYHLSKEKTLKSGVKGAIIREKGVNGDREMAYCMHLAGIEVKDVHMTDLISGRETLDELNFVVFVGGFSNSDVLGSAKGWAGAFLYNEKARKSLEEFYARDDTLSLGICNGCQLMVELGLISGNYKQIPRMDVNTSGKFESSFLCVDILENNTVMLNSLSNSTLGIWVAHGEGRFILGDPEETYHIPVKYTNKGYPGNPNGSDYNTAAIASTDGRHLAMMPHLERTLFPWNWACYDKNRKSDEISPWIEAFVNAKNWILNKSNQSQN